MISESDFRKLALSLGDITEAPHFERTAFYADTGRKRKGEPVLRIFATYDKKTHRACLKLTLADQDLLLLHDPNLVYRVPNRWGKQGWTYVELNKVRKSVLRDAIKAAFRVVKERSTLL